MAKKPTARQEFVLFNVVYEDGTEEYEGETWWPITVSAFAAEIGISADSMRRIIEKAEQDGLLVSCQPEGWVSRRKWYRVDRAEVTARVGESATSMRADSPDGNRANSPDPKVADSPVPPTSQTTREPTERPRPRNLHWDALETVFGVPETDGERKNFGKISADLKRNGCDPAEVERRAREALRRGWTVNSVNTRWSQLAPRRPPPGSTLDDVAQRDLEARR